MVETNAFTMCLDWKGDLWISGWDCGIFHYSIEESCFKNYLTDRGRPILQGRIHTIKAFEPNKIYIGSDQGLTLFDPSTQNTLPLLTTETIAVVYLMTLSMIS